MLRGAERCAGAPGLRRWPHEAGGVLSTLQKEARAVEDEELANASELTGSAPKAIRS